MAFLRSKQQPDVNAPYMLPAALVQAMSAVTEALDARARIDAAIEQNVSDRKASSDSAAAAEDVVTRLDADLALEIDDAKIIALEGAIAAARKTAHEAAIAHERADRRQGALYARAQEADAAIATARQTLQIELGNFGAAANEALAEEARVAARHLVVVLSRGHALADALGSLATHSGFLGETRIPSPAATQQPLIAGARIEAKDGSPVDLHATWRDDPTASALAGILRPVAELRRRIAGHRTFAPPPPPAKPYIVQNRRTPEEIAADRAADEAASKPVPSTWVARSWNTDQMRGARTSQAAGLELNVVAGVADSALKPDAA